MQILHTLTSTNHPGHLGQTFNQSSTSLSAHRTSEAEIRHAAICEIKLFAPRLSISVMIVLRINKSPHPRIQWCVVAFFYELRVLSDFVEWRREHHLALGEGEHVRSPTLEVIEDVSAIEDGGSSDFALSLEKLENTLPCVEIQIGSDLVHQVH